MFLAEGGSANLASLDVGQNSLHTGNSNEYVPIANPHYFPYQPSAANESFVHTPNTIGNF